MNLSLDMFDQLARAVADGEGELSLRDLPALPFDIPHGQILFALFTISIRHWAEAYPIVRRLTKWNSTTLLSPAFKYGFSYPLKWRGGCSTSVRGNDMYYRHESPVCG